MKKEDFKIGEYYHIRQNNDNYYWVLQVTDIDDKELFCGPCLCSTGAIYNKTSVSDRWGSYKDINDLDFASEQEIRWLNESIKQGRFVPLEEIPKSDIIENFEIYQYEKI